jgi:5-(carboxyamino)imidazole ribonucleotide mutase
MTFFSEYLSREITMAKNRALVAMVMGSKSDRPNLQSGIQILRDFDVPWVVRVISAHRTPLEAVKFASTAHKRGLKVIICAAGMAAHLAGVMAAHTILPVIGLPMAAEPFHGLDALLATVQMPPGIPVACVTAGPNGAGNAALLAIEILALSERSLADKLNRFREEQTLKVMLADKEIQRETART